MNPLSGISFYDALSRLSIGFLLLYPFTLLKETDSLCCCQIDNDTIMQRTLFILACYVVGLFFSILVDIISSYNNRCKLLYFYKNNKNSIQKKIKSNDIQLNSLPGDNITKKYWNIYFYVQKNGLLGNVPYLETISAFLLNLGVVCILYLLTLFVLDYYPSIISDSEIVSSILDLKYWINIISIGLLFFCWITRYYIESQIYERVICAYKFLIIENEKIKIKVKLNMQ